MFLFHENLLDNLLRQRHYAAVLSSLSIVPKVLF
jgi:hypothetical protein